MMDKVTGLLYICSGVWPFLRMYASKREIHGEQKFREVFTVPLSHRIGAQQFQHLVLTAGKSLPGSMVGRKV